MDIPAHVAIIMDGNGRWAEDRGLIRQQGHKKGVDTLKNITISASEIGLKSLTVYAFSTENWNRPKKEVNFLMNLFKNTIRNEFDELKKNNVKVKIIGRRDSFAKNLLREIEHLEESTKNNDGLILNIAFNYGGRAEIVDAAKKIIKKENINKINEEEFSKNLYLSDTPEVELLIRTGGEKRLSNFLLWELAYAELYFCDTYWPDFSEDDLKAAIEDFNQRERRFGSLK